jgi:hypothetical protein
MEADYRAFAHVLGTKDQIWANSDSLLRDGSALTSQWQAGQTVVETRMLSVGATTPPDFYDIEVGVYAPSGGRLSVMAEEGHRLGSRVFLAKVRVEEE